MKINSTHYRTIWPLGPAGPVRIIDQTQLPHRFETLDLSDIEGAAHAIRTMQVRGAPLIGVTAAYGMALGLARAADDRALMAHASLLKATRPTAVNLAWAVDRVAAALRPLAPEARAAAAFALAGAMADEDAAINQAIGRHGLGLLQELAAGLSRPLRVLTHCNAGWLATVDYGTALAPIYLAHDQGIALEVLVDETRPRNQGAALTAFELKAHGVPHRLIADNAGGHLMQQGEVDCVIVGTDRTARNGDVCNKIGTYLKALAAKDNGVPFYVALPYATIDWSIAAGADVPIEERGADEVLFVTGKDERGQLARVQVAPDGTPALNPAFDVTPARLVTALITERGVAAASEAGLRALYPEAGQ